jgi:hypothetical protein
VSGSRRTIIRLFIVLTAVELLGRLVLAGYAGIALSGVLASLAGAFGGAVRVLIPAVILWRPRSGRLAHDWLFLGFATVAVAEVAATLITTAVYVGARGGSVNGMLTLSFFLGVGVTAARIVGAMLISVGLAVTTGPRPGERPRDRSTAAAIALVLIVAVTAGFELQVVDRLGLYATLVNGTLVSILAEVAWAATAWLAITARNGPWRRSLMPLAAGAIAVLVSDLFTAVFLALAFGASGVTAVRDATTIGSIGGMIGVASAVLLVVAADRGLPGPTLSANRPGDGLPPPPPPPPAPVAAPLERP